ncbi:hypothetical protein HY346_02345 [Candidatus Microgenomates bacterium]|nr:hypothetical protein [Candidatus Microgenomates bacterium]
MTFSGIDVVNCAVADRWRRAAEASGIDFADTDATDTDNVLVKVTTNDPQRLVSFQRFLGQFAIADARYSRATADHSLLFAVDPLPPIDTETYDLG